MTLAPSAFGQTSSEHFFGHDDSRDGTASEVVSGFYPTFNADSPDPEAQRVPNTYEKFVFEVPEGDSNGTFNVNATWTDPELDFDVYVYRADATGDAFGDPIAQSAAGPLDNDEDALYIPARETNSQTFQQTSRPVEAGSYAIFVDNWCTDNDDPIAELVTSIVGEDLCPRDSPDEDDFSGKVTYTEFLPDNQAPTTGLSGPDRVATGDEATFTANASDPDGSITEYTFDLDGDGRFEYDNAQIQAVTTRFQTPGTYNVGVRAVDNGGAAAYAARTVTVTGSPTTTAAAGQKPAIPRLLSSFRLNRPVFGGRKRNRLVVRYRLREPGRAIVSLYRGKRRIQRLSAGNRRANRTYRINISPNKLRKGATYTVRLNVRSADGKRTQSARLSAKRL